MSNDTNNTNENSALQPETIPAPSESPTVRRPISIGSQRDVANPELLKKGTSTSAVESKSAESSQEQTSAASVPAMPAETSAPTPAVRSRIGLGDDLEAEIEAALQGASLEELLNQPEIDLPDLEPQSRVKVVVSRVEGEHVFCSIKGRFEGILAGRSFKEPPQPGQMIEVIVKGQNEDDGLWELALPGAAVDTGDWESLQVGDVVDARVTGSNVGGLEATVNNLRGFIPASQIDRVRVETFGDYVNQKLQCLVQEINPARKKLVLSRRAILDREFEENRKEALEKVEVGQIYDGLVTRLMDFGAFVDIGGIEGLVHIGKISWSRIKHPKEVLNVGQRVKVKIDGVNKETGKISLSHRDTVTHPWEDIETRFPVGNIVTGTVSRLAQFGAFVSLDTGIEGLIHISELAHHRVYAVKNIVKEGDQVEVKILTVDRENQKIGLSLKATQAAPEKKSNEKPEEEVVEEKREPIISRNSNEPLKGGTSRASGGDKFGLRW
ncbi:MAG: S1 RNA-binding domain-containing protein [Pirellulaceae bacterium]|nr:S1 RNA-binding domain-containing protein [Pirellulaceae bacterium]